jgi:hypothetical protein
VRNNPTDRTVLKEAIDDILSEWMYDIHCGNGDDCRKYLYIFAAIKVNAPADEFHLAKLRLLYGNGYHPHLSERIEIQRRAFFAECFERATKDPTFDLPIGSEVSRWLSENHRPLLPALELEILRIVEAAALIDKGSEKLDFVSAGHVFLQDGERFRRFDFLVVA